MISTEIQEYTFTWREHAEDDYYQTSIPARHKSEAVQKWKEWADGFWETDIRRLFHFHCDK